ncbi:MAG: alpha/beta hydrolase [Pseudomonadota bacterium]
MSVVRFRSGRRSASVLIVVLNAFGLAGQAAFADDAAFTEAADAIVTDWTRNFARVFRDLATRPEAEFVPAWQRKTGAWRAGLDAAAATHMPTDELADEYRTRLLYEWAVGMFYYESYYRGASANPDFTVSDSFNDYLDRVRFDGEDLLYLDEYTGFIRVFRDGLADERFEQSETLPGSAKYLTAKLEASAFFDNTAVRCWADGQAISKWFEENNADGVTDEVSNYASRCPGDTASALMAQWQDELASREDHIIEVYKSIGDVDLELHIYAPEMDRDDQTLKPAMVWLHGGGWFFGSWGWCGPCQFYKDRGMVVAQVEYRTRGRHATNIRDAFEDALDAIAWLRRNADQYGIDPERIGVSGFSAGAHLSLAAAGLAPSDAQSKPDIAVAFSGCADLTIDPYIVRMAGGMKEAAALSPVNAEPKAWPPLYMANATRDSDCNYEAALQFSEKAKAQGAEITFLTQENAGHFFLREPERSAQTRASVNAFLDAQGF